MMAFGRWTGTVCYHQFVTCHIMYQEIFCTPSVLAAFWVAGEWQGKATSHLKVGSRSGESHDCSLKYHRGQKLPFPSGPNC